MLLSSANYLEQMTASMLHFAAVWTLNPSTCPFERHAALSDESGAVYHLSGTRAKDPICLAEGRLERHGSTPLY